MIAAVTDSRAGRMPKRLGYRINLKPGQVGRRQRLNSDLLNDVPNILSSIAEFAACYAGTEAVVTDTDRIVLDMIGKIIVAFGHSSDEDTNTLFGAQIRNIVCYPNHFSVKTQGDLATTGRQVVRNWILYHFEQLFLRVCGAN